MLRYLVAVFIFAASPRADIIWLTTGKALEGTAKQVDGKLRITERNGNGEFELSTALVVRVDQGIWLEDLKRSERAHVEQALTVSTISEPSRTAAAAQALRKPVAWWRRLVGSGPDSRQRAYTLCVAIIGWAFFSLLSLTTFISVVITAFRQRLIIGLIALLPPLTLIYVLAFYTNRRLRTMIALLSPVLWSLIVWFILRR